MSEKQKKQWHAANRGMKDTERPNLTITNPNYVGVYEHVGAEHPVPDIDVGREARAAGGGRLTKLVTNYNEYTPLLRTTLKGMGRLRDLANAGAKLDPAAVKADHKLAGKFAINPDAAAAALKDWSSQATHEKLAVASMEAGFHQLNAAVYGFREAQNMLKARRKEAELENAQEKKNKIEETVETLEKIIDKTKSFATTAGKIETFLLTTGNVKDLEEIEAKESYDQTHSKQQSAGRAATKSRELWEKHHEKVESWIKSAGLNTHDVLVFLTGNAKEYEQLTRQISQLKNALANLHLQAENNRINSAQEQLVGMKEEIAVRIKTASVNQEGAREAAGAAGRTIAGDDDVVLAMYAAQTYQDLSIFGGAAQGQRQSRIDDDVEWLFDFLQGRDGNPQRAVVQGWGSDWEVMRAWGQDMVEQREFFGSHQPDWNEKARAWNEFFAEMSGGELVKA